MFFSWNCATSWSQGLFSISCQKQLHRLSLVTASRVTDAATGVKSCCNVCVCVQLRGGSRVLARPVSVSLFNRPEATVEQQVSAFTLQSCFCLLFSHSSVHIGTAIRSLYEHNCSLLSWKLQLWISKPDSFISQTHFELKQCWKFYLSVASVGSFTLIPSCYLLRLEAFTRYFIFCLSHHLNIQVKPMTTRLFLQLDGVFFFPIEDMYSDFHNFCVRHPSWIASLWVALINFFSFSVL